MAIGDRLKEARKAAGISQEELAALVGVSKGAIGNYETGRSSPIEPVLIKLMRVLKVDANYLYQDDIIDPINLKPDERRLLNAYRAADDRAREEAIGVLERYPRKKGEQSAI